MKYLFTLLSFFLIFCSAFADPLLLGKNMSKMEPDTVVVDDNVNNIEPFAIELDKFKVWLDFPKRGAIWKGTTIFRVGLPYLGDVVSTYVASESRLFARMPMSVSIEQALSKRWSLEASYSWLFKTSNAFTADAGITNDPATSLQWIPTEGFRAELKYYLYDGYGEGVYIAPTFIQDKVKTIDIPTGVHKGGESTELFSVTMSRPNINYGGLTLGVQSFTDWGGYKNFAVNLSVTVAYGGKQKVHLYPNMEGIEEKYKTSAKENALKLIEKLKLSDSRQEESSKGLEVIGKQEFWKWGIRISMGYRF